MARNLAADVVGKHSGGLATVYTCPFCKHSLFFRNGLRGTGRGHGLRNGGRLFHQMAAHVRAEHAAELASFGDGMAARREGKQHTVNPHNRDAPLGKAWRLGWQKANGMPAAPPLLR